jgi:HSP20 family molecular chaperone IbpA
MKNYPVSVQGAQSYQKQLAPTSPRSTAIQDLFIELVQILERLKNSPADPAGSKSIDRWDDDQYIYLETDLGAIFDSEIDINVHDGRFYVRLERS